MNPEIIQLEDGWSKLKADGIDRLEYYLENGNMPESMTDEGEYPKAGRVFAPDEYSNLYTLVYKMCTQKQPFNWSEKLYTRYSESVSYYVQQKVLPALTGKQGVALLEELKRRWVNHKLYIKWMDKFFQYLDRYYVRVRSAETVSTKGFNIFKTLIFDEVSVEATKAVLELINEDRERNNIDKDVLKTVIEMYIELGINSLIVYTREFEESLLPATAAFYAKQSRLWFETLDLPEYLMRAEESLQSEDARVGRYLHQSSLSKLRGVTIMQLLQEPQTELLGKATNASILLEQDRWEDLSRLYRMFALVDGGLGPIASAFRQFVTGKGSALVEAREEQLRNMSKTEALADSSFVFTLIELHEKYKAVVAQCFNSDTSFQKSLKEAFEVFVNKDLEKVSMAALLSSFCDKLLRKSSQDTETSIVQLVELFSFLSEKDDFAEIYRNQLAKRILSDSSSGEEAEKSLIQKLKMKCGASFTSKLEGMITDLSLAGDMQREFREIFSEVKSFEFSVTVLTTGFWPSYTPVDASLTREMELGIAAFKDFYSKRTQHRRLTWIHSLSTATVAARFLDSNGEAKRFDLVMNTYQALILLCFNTEGCSSLTVEEICRSTKLEDGFAKKLLATFIFSKFKVLLKSSTDERSIESSDVITVNESFAVPTRKVRIPPPMAGTEETHNKSKVEEDRSFSIEAAIVRVMKTKKFLQHQQLIAEVVEQLTLFKPNPKSIKQRIENLIEREFLERDPSNPNLYKYLA